MVVEDGALVTVRLAELLVEVWVALAESLGFLDEANKDGGDTSIDDFHGEEADGESKEETDEGDEPSSSRATVDSIGDQSTYETREEAADNATSGQDHSGDVIVDDSFESVLREHVPGGLGGLTEGLSVDGNLSEGVTVEVLHEAIDDAQDARENRAQDSSLSNAGSQGLDDSDEQRSQADRSERSGDSSLEGGEGWVAWHVVGHEVP